MIQLNDLRKELTEVKNELHIVHGRGFSPLDTALGGLAGGIGGALGQGAYNYSVGKPLTDRQDSAILINAGFGAFNPVGGMSSFGLGVSKATGGAFGVPTAIDAATKYLLPQGGFSPYGLGNIKF